MLGLVRALGSEVRLVGRENELATIDAAFALAQEGTLQCVTVLGDPGAGKTRLAQAVVERHRPQALILGARAHAMGRTASFGLWVDAIETHLRTLSSEQVFELCDGLLGDLAGLLRSVDVARGEDEQIGDATRRPRPRIVHALGALMTNLAREVPVIVVLDDVHDADGSSWDVLHHLSGMPLGSGILVIALARPGELSREPAAMRVQLDLEKQGQLRRVALGPLSDVALRRLAEDVLGEPLAEDAQRLLVARSQGNALFALGLVQALREREGEDAATGPVLQSLPEMIADSVRVRAAAVGPRARGLLELLAMAEGPIELGELTRVSGRTLEALAPDLEELVGARLVTEDSSSATYEVAHPLVAQTVRDDLPPARRLTIHHQLGETFIARGRLGEAALHFARSAQVNMDEAIEVLSRALGQADARGAYSESTKLLAVLAELVPAGDPRWAKVAGALRNWMFEHRTSGDVETASAALSRIDALAPEMLDM